MFAYNPGVADRSGEILGQGASQAAQINAQAMGDFGKNIGGIMAEFANQYAEGKALEAKGKGYGEFMKMHGEQLGFEPEYLDYYLKLSDREKAIEGDNIIGMQNTGRSLMSQQIVGMQMAPRATAGTGGGGGGAFFTMPGA
jgi:hypothetical protein